jgi:hypothetical protein
VLIPYVIRKLQVYRVIAGRKYINEMTGGRKE